MGGGNGGNATLGQNGPELGTRFAAGGWTITFNVGAVAAGTHHITAVAFDSTGLSAQLSSLNCARTFTVASNTAPFGYIDNAPATVAANTVITASGWAADNEDG